MMKKVTVTVTMTKKNNIKFILIVNNNLTYVYGRWKQGKKCTLILETRWTATTKELNLVILKPGLDEIQKNSTIRLKKET